MRVLRACRRLATPRSPVAAFAPLALPPRTAANLASRLGQGLPRVRPGASPRKCKHGAVDPSRLRASRVWFFLGGTVEWLTANAQLTGIGRVTTELFFASLRAGEAAAIPCALAPDLRGLASLALRVTPPSS